MLAGVRNPTEDEIGHLAECIAEGLVYSSRCLPRNDLPLALLAPPVQFSHEHLSILMYFGWYGVNEYALCDLPWGGAIWRFKTCTVWPRTAFDMALHLSRRLLTGRADGARVIE